MTSNRTHTSFRFCLIAALAAVLGSASACGGSVRPAIHSETDSPDTWTKRSLWTEKSGDTTLVMVVGRASHASLDPSMAIDNAEQDARERLALYLAGTVQAFRERLARLSAIKGKRGEVGDDDGPGVAAELTEQDSRGGRTVAETALRGLEVVNSSVDKDTDTQLVLAQLDVEKLKSVLARTSVLTDAERARIKEDTPEVRDAMQRALEDARDRAR